MYWTGIDEDIEQVVRNCNTCAQVFDPCKGTVNPWVWPSRPGQRIHADFAGPFQNNMFLIVVDACSKWIEVVPMKSTTSEMTISVLGSYFPHGDCQSSW